MIWPFKKKTDPFVTHIVQSLATDPGSWTLEVWAMDAAIKRMGDV